MGKLSNAIKAGWKSFIECVTSREMNMVMWTFYTFALSFVATLFLYFLIWFVTDNFLWKELVTDIVSQMFFFGIAAIATSLGCLKKRPTGADARGLIGVGAYVLLAFAFHVCYRAGACEKAGRFEILEVVAAVLFILSFPIYTKVGKRLLKSRS